MGKAQFRASSPVLRDAGALLAECAPSRFSRAAFRRFWHRAFLPRRQRDGKCGSEALETDIGRETFDRLRRPIPQVSAAERCPKPCTDLAQRGEETATSFISGRLG